MQPFPIQIGLLCLFEISLQLTLYSENKVNKILDTVAAITSIIIIITNYLKKAPVLNHVIILLSIVRLTLLQLIYNPSEHSWILVFSCFHWQRVIISQIGYHPLLPHVNLVFLLILSIRSQASITMIPILSLSLLILGFLMALAFLQLTPKKPPKPKEFASRGNSIQTEFKKQPPTSSPQKDIISIQKPRVSWQSKKSKETSPKQYIDANESKRDAGTNSLLNSKNLQIQYQVGTSALHETSQMEDEIILKQYNWIKGLNFIVFDNEENLIYQTFTLSNYFNQSRSFNQISEQEYLQSLLTTNILVGNRDLYEVLFDLDPNDLHSYKSNIENKENNKENVSYITYEDYPKYMMRAPTPLIDLIRKIASDYEKFRKSYFIVYKMESSQNELQNTIIKFFVTKKKQKNYVFLQFDSPQQITAAQAKQIFNQSRLVNSLFTLFSQSISSFLNCIITLAHIAQGDNSVDDVVYDKYFLPIQISSLQIYLTLANLRDFNLFLQNKLKLKLSTFRIAEIVEETISLLSETATAKNMVISFDFEMQEQFQFVNSDLERFKQLLHIVIKHCLKFSSNGQLTIHISQSVTNFLQFQIRNPILTIDEKELRQLNNNIRKNSFSASLSIMEISQRGLNDELPLIVANILARQLAGTFKKGLEITKNSYTFYLESFADHPIETNQSESHSAIKIVGDHKYFENSLSYIMSGHPSDSFAQEYLQRDSSNKQIMDHSLHFSLSQISKQMSHKQSDHQSAYFSQMSRMSKFRQDSNLSKIPNSKSMLNNSRTLRQQKSNQSQNNLSVNNLSLKFLENQSYASQSAYNLENKLKNPNSPSSKQQQLFFNYIKNQDLDGVNNKSQPIDSSVKEMSKLSFSDQQVQVEIQADKKAFFKSWRGSNQFIPNEEANNNNNNNNNNNSKTQIEFDSEYRYNIHVPHGIQPKLMTTVFKYKLSSQCCSKVLIADSEYLNMQVLELILSNYTKKIERVFSGEEALKKIDEKHSTPCQCGNKSFLLYFINLELPVKSNIFQYLKSKGGFFVSKSIKERMVQGSLDKGFVIGNTGMIDFHTKLECYRNGMDNYLSLPLDILEIYQVLKQLSF